MIKAATHLPIGSLVFLIDSETLMLRVDSGFRNILLGTRSVPIVLNKLTTTTVEPDVYQPPRDTEVVTKLNGPMLHLIAANEPYSGAMQGVSGADYVCYREARRSGLTGTFRAFLTSRVQDLDSIVHRDEDKIVPIANANDQELFKSWVDIFKRGGDYFNPKVPILSFDGRDVMTDPAWKQKIVWHGSDAKGHRLVDAYCNAWHSDSVDSSGIASSLTKGRLLGSERYSCNNAFILLCVEITARSDLLK